MTVVPGPAAAVAAVVVSGLPADRFVWLSIPHEERSKGQVACGKGCATVWAEILTELRRRGAQIFTDTEGGPL